VGWGLGCLDVWELGSKISGEVGEVAKGVVGDVRGSRVVEAELSLEAGVMIDGADENGEDGVRRDRLVEESEVRNGDAVGREVLDVVGYVGEAGSEFVVEVFQVGCCRCSVLYSHSLHHNWNCNSRHAVNRIRDQGTVCRTDRFEDDGGELGEGELMGVEFLQVAFVGGHEGVGGVAGGSDGRKPSGCRADNTGDEIGRVSLPRGSRQDVDQEAIDGVGLAVGNAGKHGGLEPVGETDGAVFVECWKDGLGGHFFALVWISRSKVAGDLRCCVGGGGGRRELGGCST